MAGSIVECTCITMINDEFWPVFVFPDHSAPQNFIRTRPKNKPLALPCLILCRHHFKWFNSEDLFEYVPSDDHTSNIDLKSPSGRERHKAFLEAIEFHGMDYYHDLVMNKEGDSRKRAFVVDDDSDEDDEDGYDSDCRVISASLSLAKKDTASSAYPTPKKTPSSLKSNKKQKFINLTLDNNDDDELPDPSTFTPTKATGKRPRPRPRSAKAQAFKVDEVAQEQLRLMNIKKGDGKNPVGERKELEATHDPSKVNIYVGAEDKLFIVDKKSIKRYPRFAEEMVGNEEVGYRIQWERLDDINVEVFKSVAEYFNTSDYTPILIDGRFPHLKNVKSMNQLEAAAEKASLLWDFAAEFEMEDLQQLVRRKIDAQSPLASNSLLILTRMVYWRDFNGKKVDKDMRNFLKDQISERFYDIMVDEALLLRRVLQGSEELRSYVHDRLSKERGLGSSKAMEDDNVEEEDQDDEEVYDDE